MQNRNKLRNNSNTELETRFSLKNNTLGQPKFTLKVYISDGFISSSTDIDGCANNNIVLSLFV